MTTLPSRVRSPAEAYQALEDDFSQRKRELINLQVGLGSRRQTPVLLKSAILLAYAHVEGAAKAGLTLLLRRLNSSGLRWDGVRPELSYFEIDHRLARQTTGQGRRPVISGDETTMFLRSLPQERINLDISDLISRIGVMNANTLRKILSICAFEVRRYDADLELLDDKLVSRRHELAHGSLLPVEPISAETAVRLALSLLDAMLNDFGNLLVTQSYILAADGVVTPI